MDIKRLEKLIRLTSSDNDHEALLALRNAQKMLKGDLWEFIQSAGGIKSSSSASDRVIRSLQHQIAELKDKMSELTKKLSEARKASRGFNLQKYMKIEGFYLMHYKVLLHDWADEMRLEKHVKGRGYWVSLTDLKNQFERSIDMKTFHEEISVKRFSQFFSEYIGAKAIKGGKTKDQMGFALKIWDFQ